jgi:hypothetical protein
MRGSAPYDFVPGHRFLPLRRLDTFSVQVCALPAHRNAHSVATQRRSAARSTCSLAACTPTLHAAAPRPTTLTRCVEDPVTGETRTWYRSTGESPDRRYQSQRPPLSLPTAPPCRESLKCDVHTHTHSWTHFPSPDHQFGPGRHTVGGAWLRQSWAPKFLRQARKYFSAQASLIHARAPPPSINGIRRILSEEGGGRTSLEWPSYQPCLPLEWPSRQPSRLPSSIRLT